MIQAPLGSLALSHSIASLSSRSLTSRSTQYPTRRRSSSLEREWNFPTPSSLRRARWIGSILRPCLVLAIAIVTVSSLNGVIESIQTFTDELSQNPVGGVGTVL